MKNENLVVAGHMPQLDGIRGIAIISVLFYHFSLKMPELNTFYGKLFLSICEVGWVGVDLFFVLSGFLITGILIKSKEKPRYFTNFYARRTLRIFPIYYANLFIFFILIPAVATNVPIALREMAQHQVWFWTYLSNYFFAIQGDFNSIPGGYFWSLAVEEQFYLVWPLLIYFMPLKKFSYVCFTLFIACFFGRMILLFCGISTTAAYTMTFTHMDGLLLGSLLSTLLNTQSNTYNIKKVLCFSAIVSFFGCILIIYFTGSFHFWDYEVALIGYSFLSIIFLYLLLLSLYRKGKISYFFKNKIFIFFGKYSYSLYLFHIPVSRVVLIYLYDPNKHLIISEFISILIFYFISVTLSILMSYVSWHIFEKQVLKLKTLFV